MDNANQLVQLIRDIIRDEIKNQDCSANFVVRQVNANDTYDISVYPDLESIISNVPNASKYEFNVGDTGVLYKINNKLNNSFIINKNIIISNNIKNTITENNQLPLYTFENLKIQNSGFYKTNDGFYRSDFVKASKNNIDLCKITFNYDCNLILYGIYSTSSKYGQCAVSNVNKILLSGENNIYDETNAKYSFTTSQRNSYRNVNYGSIKKGDFITCRHGGDDRGADGSYFQFKLLLS